MDTASIQGSRKLAKDVLLYVSCVGASNEVHYGSRTRPIVVPLGVCGVYSNVSVRLLPYCEERVSRSVGA